MHGDFALQLEAVEMVEDAGGCLAEQGQREEEASGTAGLLRTSRCFVFQQRLVEHVPEPLDGRHVFNMHRV